MTIGVIIPALNEEGAIGRVIQAIPSMPELMAIVVVDNGSSDQTTIIAKNAGAIVLSEPRKGYGYACLRGIEYLKLLPSPPDIIVFIDGDFSDYPEEIFRLILPIQQGEAALVIGSRVLGNREKGALTPQQIFGNWLSTILIRTFYRVTFTDLGPFRAILFQDLIAMKMQDKTYGWTVEMQVKAAKMNLKCKEVPVSYRKRIGTSKVSGTIKGTIMAGYKILWTIFRELK